MILVACTCNIILDERACALNNLLEFSGFKFLKYLWSHPVGRGTRARPLCIGQLD